MNFCNSQVLQSVQVLFGIPVTQFHELERLGRDIEHLNRLYVLYDSFVEYNEDLRNSMWNQTNLEEVTEQITEMLTRTTSLPQSLHGWAAYTEMAGILQSYSDVCCFVLFVDSY